MKNLILIATATALISSAPLQAQQEQELNEFTRIGAREGAGSELADAINRAHHGGLSYNPDIEHLIGYSFARTMQERKDIESFNKISVGGGAAFGLGLGVFAYKGVVRKKLSLAGMGAVLLGSGGLYVGESAKKQLRENIGEVSGQYASGLGAAFGVLERLDMANEDFEQLNSFQKFAVHSALWTDAEGKVEYYVPPKTVLADIMMDKNIVAIIHQRCGSDLSVKLEKLFVAKTLQKISSKTQELGLVKQAVQLDCVRSYVTSLTNWTSIPDGVHLVKSLEASIVDLLDDASVEGDSEEAVERSEQDATAKANGLRLPPIL